MKRLLFISLVLFPLSGVGQLFPNLGGQRVGVSTMTFLKNDMNPSSLGMGGASIAMKDNPFGMNANPASITDVNNLEIALSDMVYGMNINQGFLSVKFPLARWQTMGVSINNLSSGPMDVRTEFQPEGTGQKYFVQNTAIGLTYSRFLSTKFSFGATLKYYYERLAQYTNHTAGFDLGFLYRTEFKDLSFAVAVSNFGGGSQLMGDHLEVSYNRDSVQTDNFTLPTTFSMGLSMIPYQEGDHEIYTAIQLDHPNDNAESLRLGVRYRFKQRVSVRLGYMLNIDDHSWPTFGAGYEFLVGAHRFRADYAVDITNFMGVRHVFGVSMLFRKREARDE